MHISQYGGILVLNPPSYNNFLIISYKYHWSEIEIIEINGILLCKLSEPKIQRLGGKVSYIFSIHLIILLSIMNYYLWWKQFIFSSSLILFVIHFIDKSRIRLCFIQGRSGLSAVFGGYLSIHQYVEVECL